MRGRSGMGMGLCRDGWDGFKVCADRWGRGQKFVPVQVSSLSQGHSVLYDG